MTENEDLLRAAANVRDQDFANMLVLAIGIAAETHPELLRTALAKVFDISAIEDMTKRIMIIASDAQAKLKEIVAQVGDVTGKVKVDIQRLSNMFDEIRFNIEVLKEPCRGSRSPRTGAIA